MQTTKRMLVAGLVAAALLVTPAAFGPETAVSVAYAAERTRPLGTTDAAPAEPVSYATREPLQGAATGDGPATDADCERYAESINEFLDVAEVATENGRTKDANRTAGQAQQVMDMAENQGCFWIH